MRCIPFENRNGVIINELAHRGHNVTVISPFSDRSASSGAHYIIFGDEFESSLTKFVKEFMNSHEAVNPFYEQFIFANSYTSVCSGRCVFISFLLFLWMWFILLLTESLNTSGFRTLLNYPNDFKFDVIINDFSIGSCLLPFLHKFNYPPLVAISAYGHPPYLNDLVGGHHYYAYVPHNTLKLDGKMSFYHRFFNFLIHFEEMM